MFQKILLHEIKPNLSGRKELALHLKIDNKFLC